MSPDQESNESVQATDIGEPAIGIVPGARYTRLDREFSSYKWSPNSQYVALHLDDRRNLRKEAIPNYIGEQTTKENPYGRQIYRMSEKGGTITQVTSLPGLHRPALSPAGRKLSLLHSNDTTRPSSTS